MIVYCLTNNITGKQYVGQTTGTLKQRLCSHKYRAGKEPRGFALSAAMKKYGFHNFDARILQECKTQAELDAAEIGWMERLNTFAPHGYNIRVGGSRGRHSEATKAKLRARIITPEWRAKLSAATKGRKLTPERRAMAIAALRRAVHRPLRGEENGRAKLKRTEVFEIREIYKSGGISQLDIAAAYGVNQTMIGFIVRGVSWATSRSDALS